MVKKLACQNNSESDAIESFMVGPPKVAKSKMKNQAKNDPPYKIQWQIRWKKLSTPMAVKAD